MTADGRFFQTAYDARAAEPTTRFEARSRIHSATGGYVNNRSPAAWVKPLQMQILMTDLRLFLTPAGLPS
jgi:hypothetical protein